MISLEQYDKEEMKKSISLAMSGTVSVRVSDEAL